METHCKIRNITSLHSPPLLARCDHTATYHPQHDALYIFGGETLVKTRGHREIKNLTNSVYKYDFASRKWERLECEGVVPLVRHHSCCAYKNSLLVFGGEIHTIEFRSVYNGRLFQLHIPTREWRRDRAVMDPRLFHSAVMYKDSMIVFGGKGDLKLKNDLQVFDLTKSKWFTISVRGHKPKPRMKHAAVVVNDSMFILGGYGYVSYYGKYSMPLFDINEFDIPSKTWREINFQTSLSAVQTSVVVGHYIVGIDAGRIVNSFDLKMWNWVKIQMSGDIPSTRYSYAVVERNGCLYLFGGSEKNCYYDDLHELDLREAPVKKGLLNILYKKELCDIEFVFREMSGKYKYIKIG